ncbi:GNAT family N-acetyltransferase [Streptomyces sp. NBC_00859]|uniref:GNAT family N-acetyltransferase n=1 Tax=Streptomyces sp. NBC_00859 TaxID=2903682 RepID=UPI003870D10B|nr:GNAT family N-acetyltransferase [Streptomyces sp. NBC_00859]
MPDTTPYLAAGPRVGIRPFSYDDAGEFTALVRESRDLHHPWLAPPADPEGFLVYARRLIEDPSKAGFLVCEHEAGAAGRIAGFINVNNIVEGAFRSGALGYGAFAHAAGRGLMGEGLRLVMAYAFGPLGLHRLEVNIQPANEASLALIRRAGFRLEGYSPDFLFIDGAWRDHERWAFTAEMTVR